MRKKHITFVHIHDNTFACRHQQYTVLTSIIQKRSED